MSRHVPHQNSFDKAKRLEFWQNIILIVATAFTVASIVLNNIKQEKVQFDLNQVIDAVNAISSVFAVAYIAFDLGINHWFYKSGREKRLDLVDHAFETNFSGEKSTGYFNAQGVNKGVYKLSVLTFENSLFTSEIAKRMTYTKWGVTILIALVFIFSAALGNKWLVNDILQIAATGVLIQQAIRLQQFSDRMANIHSDFKALFNDLKDMADKSPKEGEMLRNILNYESTHSWGSILLDSKLFNKLNPELSVKWDRIKQNYNIG